MSSKTLYPRPPRHRKDKSGRRYRVDYNNLVFDDGEASWVSYYRTKVGAYVISWWKYYVASYASGTVVITDQREER